MRRTVLFGSVLLPVALVAAGCTSNVPRAGGPGGPITPPPATVPIVSSVPTVPPTTPPASTSPSAPRPHSSTTKATPTILGHFGFGALKLGMSSKQALSTGLIVAWTGKLNGECALRSHLEAARGEGSGNDGTVLFSGNLGVEIIDAYPGVSTPEGIHIGSTKTQMLKAYPDWRPVADEDPNADGRGMPKVPGNSDAVYRIVTYKGKVVQLTLQLAHQDCYE